MDTRLLGKPCDFSGAQEAWRDLGTVFKEYAGAAVPRLQKLMDDAAKAATPIPNATILEDDDRAACAQLYWMMLMICKVQLSTPCHPVLLIPERITAWERGIATYERDSGKTLDVKSRLEQF